MCRACDEEFYVSPPNPEYYWIRFNTVWDRFLEGHWNPSLVLSVSIYDLRKIDRSIDHVLRKLLDSEYKDRIRLYGAPSSQFGRHPFRDNEGRVWLLIRRK